MILGDVLERNARLYPRGEAVVSESRRSTHAEMSQRVRRLVNALDARGVGRQERVAIYAQNCAEYLEVYGAGELGGFIVATVNFRLAAPEIAYILNDCGASVLVFQEQYAGVVHALRGSLPQVRHFVCIGSAPPWAEAYESVLAGASAELPSVRATEQDGVYIIYTSGATGRPKGVLLGQREAFQTAQVKCVDDAILPTDRLLLVMPLYHIGAKCVQLGHVWRGCTVATLAAFDPRVLLETIQRERITTLLLAPVMVRAVLDFPDLRAYDVSSLRTIIYSAAPMPVPLLRRAMEVFGPIFLQHYGMTESGPMGTTLHKHQHVLDGPAEQVRRLASAGQPCPTYEVRVVDEHGGDCAVGQSGEILLRSEVLMRGYWNNPAATDEVLRDGWLHTGDIGLLDEEQFLFIVDRKKDMVVSGGENIYPREVEEALYQHPGVSEVAVIGVPDAQWGESVKAFVVLRDGAGATEQELIEHTRTLIASYKKPRSIELVASLPKLPNGKVDKVQLREPYWRGHSRGVQ